MTSMIRFQGRERIKRAPKRFKRLRTDMTDHRVALSRVVPILKGSAERAFRSKGSSAGATWPPLTARYRARKGRGRIGVVSGALGRGISSGRGSVSKLRVSYTVKGPKHARPFNSRRPFMLLDRLAESQAIEEVERENLLKLDRFIEGLG